MNWACCASDACISDRRREALQRSWSESRMRKIRTSGLMSGEEKRSHWQSLNATALLLDSTTSVSIVEALADYHMSKP